MRNKRHTQKKNVVVGTILLGSVGYDDGGTGPAGGGTFV